MRPKSRDEKWPVHRHIGNFRVADEIAGKIQIGENPGENLPLQQAQCVGIVASLALQRRRELSQALDVDILWRNRRDP